MSQLGKPNSEVQRLAMYFRQNPAALSEAPEAIADATGASIETVRSLMEARSSNVRGGFRPNTDAIQDAFRSVVYGFDRLIRYPLLFITVTFLLTAFVLWNVPEGSARASGTGFQFTLNQAFQVGLVGMTLLVQLACYFRVGMVRYALMGAGVLAALLYAILATQILVSPPPARDLTKGMLLMLIGLATVILAVVYAGFAAGASLLGAYLRIRREEAARHRRTRQELLQRLFEVEEALAASSNQPDAQPRLIDLFQGVAGRVWWWAIGTAFGWGLLVVVLTTAFPVLNLNQGRSSSLVAPFVMLAITGAWMATQVFLSYLTGRPLKAVLVSLVFVLTYFTAHALPIGTYGVQWFTSNSPSVVTNIILMSLTGLFAGLGAMVEERAYLAKRRGANAPEVLLAEMIELRRALNRGEQHRCVMVVDAARSSMMKSKSDPLVAEWSFRAYQEFLANMVASHQGRIHSTAGDGAVAAFDSAEDAFQCARAIQTYVVDFNQNVNRLRDPFRLRIGLHCGVSGELDEVQFAAVIDIAAHIEAASQVGGIAVTGAVAERLPDHRFAELHQTIDEQRVLVALNPTLDPDDED